VNNSIYAVNNEITGRSVVVEYAGDAWYVSVGTAIFQFFTYKSAVLGAQAIAGMHR
jgi:hypothetical protein